MKVFKVFSTKTKSDYYNQEFSKKHLDLAPRNVYLREGRILHLEDVNKYLDKIGNETFSEKCKRYLGNIKDLFRKKV